MYIYVLPVRYISYNKHFLNIILSAIKTSIFNPLMILILKIFWVNEIFPNMHSEMLSIQPAPLINCIVLNKTAQVGRTSNILTLSYST